MADLGDGFPLATDDEVITRIAKHYGVPEEDALFMLAIERGTAGATGEADASRSSDAGEM
jgi:hypothetical protein